jgi:hypothetical protein
MFLLSDFPSSKILNKKFQMVKAETISHERSQLLPSDNSSTTNTVISKYELAQARKLLYLSHLFNQFSENAWQFCLVLFLAAFSNYESFILVSTYGLVSGLSVCCFGPKIGRFIDGTERLLVARLFIGLENFAVLSATFCCYALLSNREDDTTRMSGVPTDPKSVFLLIGIHILGAMARVLDSGFIVAIERDWVVEMSQSLDFPPDLSRSENSLRDKMWLTETNVFLKQIDLSCQIAAPAFAGFIVAYLDDGTDPHHGSDLRGAAIFVGCLNASALVVEYIW